MAGLHGGSRLNPCFSGCWSRTGLLIISFRSEMKEVLILVLVDVGLGRPFPSTTGKLYVLILVLVDVGLGLLGRYS